MIHGVLILIRFVFKASDDDYCHVQWQHNLEGPGCAASAIGRAGISCAPRFLVYEGCFVLADISRPTFYSNA